MLWVGQQQHKRADKPRWRHVSRAGEDEVLKSIQHFAHFTLGTSKSEYSEDEVWKACMFHADGSLARPGVYRVQVSRPRKREKIGSLLGKPGVVSSNIRECHNLRTETWSYEKFSSPLLVGKEFCLDTLGSNQADTFVAALAFWDGSQSTNNSRTGRIVWGSVKKEEVDKVQSYLVRSGYEAKLRVSPINEESNYYCLSIRKRGVTRFSTKAHIAPSGRTSLSSRVEVHTVNMDVACFEVPSGFLVVRQHGQVFVSGNCAGEPTVSTHYSQDPMYRLATFDMVGKAPYYRDDGLLIIDDIYLMTASKSPMGGEQAVREAFNSLYDGKTFAEKWLEDPEYLAKGVLKKVRELHKICCLGIGYSMMPKKIKLTAFLNGYNITMAEAKGFYTLYWDIFKGMDALGKKLQQIHKKQGFIVNDFGYALYPNKAHKCLNYLIQSSVSGLMHMLKVLFFERAPWALFIAVIHDEILFSVPIDRREETQRLFFEAVAQLNAMLNWTVRIRCGYKEGEDFFSAK
jgi:hypothetical protein